jgi:2-oxoglutarate dehydrogenase complex dehydrogenase (E1) component-like enzyme
MRGFEAASLANKDYVADQYRRWKDDPSSVDEQWAIFFAGFDLAFDGNGDGAPPTPSATGRAARPSSRAARSKSSACMASSRPTGSTAT